LLVDVEQVERNYNEFANHISFADCYYAIKANLHPDILDVLVLRGSFFDCATLNEIKMVLASMERVLSEGKADPSHISYGNMKKNNLIFWQLMD
jgi:ornithine decarboxylase